MCIMIWKDEGFTLSEDILRNCWDSNKDGAGFMYVENEELHIVKGLMTFEHFLEEYEKVGHLPAVIHFRIATHGEKNEENTHPFRISNKLAVAHNGIISAIIRKEEHMSDTWNFTESVLKPMYKFDGQFISRPYNQELISEYIGASKLIFLDNKGRATIINEGRGEWVDGVWFSNSSYKPKQKLPVVHSRWQQFYGKSALLDKGDFVKVINVKWANCKAKVGDVGLIDKIHKNGYYTVVFHDFDPITNNVTETIQLFHEDDIEYTYIYGAV